MTTVTVTSDAGRADVAARFQTASGISERRRIQFPPYSRSGVSNGRRQGRATLAASPVPAQSAQGQEDIATRVRERLPSV
jgi:hypothetical protein